MTERWTRDDVAAVFSRRAGRTKVDLMNDTVSLARADLSAHGDCGGECDGPEPQPMGIGALYVFRVTDDGWVTITAGPEPPEKGGNRIEMDLSPAEARRLALVLLTASGDAGDGRSAVEWWPWRVPL